MIVPTGLFEVTGHLNHSIRGALLVGNMKSGLIQPGMSLASPVGPDSFMVASVEFMDSISPGKHRVALFLKDSPPFDRLKELFPLATPATASTHKET